MTDLPTREAIAPELAATCDGKEQYAFEEWAKSERFDMGEHPLHYLFLDTKTDAARRAWKAGLLYASDIAREREAALATPIGEPAVDRATLAEMSHQAWLDADLDDRHGTQYCFDAGWDAAVAALATPQPSIEQAVADERERCARIVEGQEIAPIIKQRIIAEFGTSPASNSHVDLIEALAKVMPLRINDGPDYAEVYFSDGSKHSTQAMTMNPQDWRDLQSAWDCAAIRATSVGDKL